METKVRAVKMTYDVANEEWARTTLRVSFSRAPFASGGMRDCYRAFEHCADGDVFEMVAKVFKPECDAADHEYFDEAITQVGARSAHSTLANECYAMFPSQNVVQMTLWQRSQVGLERRRHMRRDGSPRLRGTHGCVLSRWQIIGPVVTS